LAETIDFDSKFQPTDLASWSTEAILSLDYYMNYYTAVVLGGR